MAYRLRLIYQVVFCVTVIISISSLWQISENQTRPSGRYFLSPDVVSYANGIRERVLFTHLLPVGYEVVCCGAYSPPLAQSTALSTDFGAFSIVVNRFVSLLTGGCSVPPYDDRCFTKWPSERRASVGIPNALFVLLMDPLSTAAPLVSVLCQRLDTASGKAGNSPLT